MNVLTVAQVNTYIHQCFDDNPIFSNVFVCGEISNFLHYNRSGHFYFTLKDEKSQLKAVMFSSYNQRIKFAPKNGMSVICRGKISSYERDGIYQLYVEDMQPDGYGALNLAYEQLKEKLMNEGLFDELRKRPIPKYPKKIGVVTSNMGAAIQDITKILARRYPIADVLLYPALVQGDDSAEDIVKGINKLNQTDVDVIIVGRGGGSIEDLWSFNTEIVARAVANSKIPIISAVGHETDFTICDFVADLRAATPSAAAELAVVDKYNEQARLFALVDKMKSLILTDIDKRRLRLDNVNLDNTFIYNKKNSVNLSFERINKEYYDLININKNKLQFSIGKINALNPLAVLQRGYCVVSNNDNTISSVTDVNKSDKINIKMYDGCLNCTVNEVLK